LKDIEIFKNDGFNEDNCILDNSEYKLIKKLLKDKQNNCEPNGLFKDHIYYANYFKHNISEDDQLEENMPE